MYAADDLPHLRPAYGNAPCPRSSPNDHVGDDHGGSELFLGDDDGGSELFLGGSTRQENADAPMSNDGQTPGSVGEDAGNHPDTSSEDPTKIDAGMDFEEPTRRDSATERRQLGAWPHEPKFCASVWPTKDRDEDDNSAGAVPPRLVVLFFFAVLLGFSFFIFCFTEEPIYVQVRSRRALGFQNTGSRTPRARE